MVVTSGVLTASDVDNPGAPDPQTPYAIDRGDQRVEVAPWPFPPEAAGEAPEFRFDPHVWTSPKNAIVQVTNIGAALEKAAPDQAGVFRSHVDAYVAKLKKLDEWAAGSLNSVPQDKRVLFTSHDAFGYFSKEFGVKFEGAALSDFNAQQDATADKNQQTADKVKSSGAVAIFAENSNNPKSIQKVAEVAGVKAVIGDEARLRQVVVNLLANARVHTPAGSHVTTTLAREGDTLIVRIHDDGPGIAPDVRDRLFERFARGDSSRERRTGSTGLGMSIALAIVQSHGGSIDVDSSTAPEDHGTTFSVRLPAAAVEE